MRGTILVVMALLLAGPTFGCRDEVELPAKQTSIAQVETKAKAKAAPRAPEVNPRTPATVPPRAQLPPGHPPVGDLPPGHPPTGDRPRRPVVGEGRSLEGMRRVEVAGRTFEASPEWKRQTPSSRMRAAQFLLPRVKGDSADATVTVIAAGGSVDANIERWTTQFADAPKVEKTVRKTPAGEEVTIVTMGGTYLLKARPMGPGKGEPMKDYLVKTLVIGAKDQHIFIKGWGPRKTMMEWDRSFDSVIQTLK